MSIFALRVTFNSPFSSLLARGSSARMTRVDCSRRMMCSAGDDMGEDGSEIEDTKGDCRLWRTEPRDGETVFPIRFCVNAAAERTSDRTSREVKLSAELLLLDDDSSWRPALLGNFCSASRAILASVKRISQWPPGSDLTGKFLGDGGQAATKFEIPSRR